MGKYDSNNFFKIDLLNYMKGSKNHNYLLNDDLKMEVEEMDFKDIEITIVRFYQFTDDCHRVECLIKNNSLNNIKRISFNVKFFDKNQNLVSVSNEKEYDLNSHSEKVVVFQFLSLPSNACSVSISVDKIEKR